MRRSVVVLIAAGLVGCTHASDIEIHNPMTAKAVGPNRIIKPHDYIERERGLPPGSVADEAQLVSVDAQQVCFAVTLREIDPIEITRAEVRLSAPKSDTLTVAKMWPEPPTMRTYAGRIPERRQTGFETVCSSQDQYGNCLAWQTRPVYATVWVPGPVNVHEARGRMCFENRGLVTSATPQLSLDVRVPRFGGNVTYTLWGGGSRKRVVFRWGFLGVAKL